MRHCVGSFCRGPDGTKRTLKPSFSRHRVSAKRFSRTWTWSFAFLPDALLTNEIWKMP